MSAPLTELANAGVSIWLDDLSREMMTSGDLGAKIRDQHVVGVTTNPSIFAKALSDGESYDTQVRELAERDVDVHAAVFELTTSDVREACDRFRHVFDETGGVDGRVSIEVSPELAFDTDATLAAAHRLWSAVDRENLFVKIPATAAGIPAITDALAAGISVNVTLIFGLRRYAEVMAAYLEGLEKARANGHDLSRIHSVASFFVSRVDTEIDRRLDEIGTDEARRLKGRAAVANARLAHRDYRDFFAGERWESLAAEGANTQRPLWASTGVKNPDYPDTLYVTDLVVDNVVNTMPEKTLAAFADHGEVHGDRVTDEYPDAAEALASLQGVGIDYDDVIAVLEQEGVDKFVSSWHELTETVQGQLDGVVPTGASS